MLDANITPDKVDFVNAHATSTKIGDAAEALAIKKMFYNPSIHSDMDKLKAIDPHTITLEDLSPDVKKRTAVTAHKASFGHTQTSSGSIEIVYSIL
jgi:3-oxoacyl-(acyl-carrier-protein) synthase